MKQVLVPALLFMFLLPSSSGYAQINVQNPPYSAACNGTTDDSLALSQAVAAANAANSSVFIPPGCHLGVNSTQITLGDVKIYGSSSMDVGNSQSCCSQNYGLEGSQIWLLNYTQPPFLLGSGVAFENVNFYWPKQNEAYATSAYPIMLNGATASGQTETITLNSSNPTATVPVSIPQNTNAAAAALLLANAVNANSTITGAGGFASLEGMTVSAPPPPPPPAPPYARDMPALQQEITGATVSAPGGVSPTASYAPNDTITLAGGAHTTAGTLKVATTQVVAASVASGGTGCTNGSSKTMTGTTGTGTKFKALVTVAGNSITAVNSISVAGNYTVNPTNLSSEPVTGDACSGAALAISMGVLSLAPLNQPTGLYGIIPANPVTQASTSGHGSNATFNLTWNGILNGALVTVSSPARVASASIYAGGSGCTNGSSQTVTGTTGAGTLFSADVTVSGGTITAVNSISGGSYTLPPLSFNEPVTGDGCSGAVLTITLAPTITWTISTSSPSYISANMSPSGSPVAFPPLFQQAPGYQINRFDFINSQVSNAFDFLAQPTQVIGQAHIAGAQIYALNSVLRLTSQPEIFKVVDSYFSHGTFYDAPSTFLTSWTANNGTWLSVEGNGTTSSPSTTLVQAMRVDAGTFVFGYATFVHVSTGWLDLSNFNVALDGTQVALQVDPSGGITNTQFGGGSYWILGSTSVPAIYINPNSAAAGNVTFDTIYFDSVACNLFNVANDSVDIRNTTTYINAQPNAVCTWLDFNGGTAHATVQNNKIIVQNNTTSNGVVNSSPGYFLTLIGNTFVNEQTPINFASSLTATLVGNTTIATQGSYSVLNCSTSVIAAANNFDKPINGTCGP